MSGRWRLCREGGAAAAGGRENIEDCVCMRGVTKRRQAMGRVIRMEKKLVAQR